MALCRCKEKHNNPKGRKDIYVNFVEPLGYPKTSSQCGRKDCENPGLIWLTKKEWNEYQGGTDLFRYATNVSKVRVKLSKTR